jgi:xylan 1,4-beta-xylosidase
MAASPLVATLVSVLLRNPILCGSSPDPCILRVGGHYFIATSTFEWFPGVRLHHSTDLRHWRRLRSPLDRPGQMDLRGVPDSGGVWAPSLSHDGGRFHLVYPLITARRAWPLVSVSNYLVSAPDIGGPWSDPVFLHGRGWDPSLFHEADHDGRSRTWLLNMALDQRPGRQAFRGIELQEVAWPAAGAGAGAPRLVGAPKTIFAGTSLGSTEGPHLYRHQGRFYLLTAEGGTSWDHAVTVARAERIHGPYLADPAGPMLTSRGRPDLPLQKAGHGSLVCTPGGEWYLAHLCARPLLPEQLSPLGRETALQRVIWTVDGGPRLDDADPRPRSRVHVALQPGPAPAPGPDRDDFDGPALSPVWSTLRAAPEEHWLSLGQRPGYLRLRGREALFSWHETSVVARPWRSLSTTMETSLEFEPDDDHQAAGLICWRDSRDFLFLAVTWNGAVGKHLALLQMDRGHPRATDAAPVPLERGRPCHLRAHVAERAIGFWWSADGETWQPIGSIFSTGQLADEYDAKDSFTGAFAGMAAQDVAYRRKTADFAYFSLRDHAT